MVAACIWLRARSALRLARLHGSLRAVCRLTIKSLGGEGCTGHAKTVVDWLEQGVFDALGKGYLEKAILCMAADEECEDVLEMWSLSVAWHTDEDGVQHPTLQTTGPRTARW